MRKGKFDTLTDVFENLIYEIDLEFYEMGVLVIIVFS